MTIDSDADPTWKPDRQDSEFPDEFPLPRLPHEHIPKSEKRIYQGAAENSGQLHDFGV